MCLLYWGMLPELKRYMSYSYFIRSSSKGDRPFSPHAHELPSQPGILHCTSALLVPAHCHFALLDPVWWTVQQSSFSAQQVCKSQWEKKLVETCGLLSNTCHEQRPHVASGMYHVEPDLWAWLWVWPGHIPKSLGMKTAEVSWEAEEPQAHT